MNIAHVLAYSAHFPLAKHNGRYEWVLRLATLQATQGHHVTIYSSPASQGDIPGVTWASFPDGTDDHIANNLGLLRLAFANPEHDIFHSHLDSLHYLVADETPKPIVFTQHWFPTDEVAAAAQQNRTHNVLAVPVTKYMAAQNAHLGIPSAEVIYHGIDLSLFRPGSEPKSDRLVFVGRIYANKGVKEAVAIARQAKVPLDIIGKINKADEAYWQSILPDVDGVQIRYLGSQTQAEVAASMAAARAMLFPSQHIEAFGQTTIEAQACGTPVIIHDLGASRELVQDGKTGFVVNTTEEYLAAIAKVDSIDPADCRSFAEQFDSTAMAAAYETLYSRLITASAARD